MLRLLSLIFAISLTSLYAAEFSEFSAPDWEEVKRKISVLSERDQLYSAIESIKAEKVLATRLYSHLQNFTNINDFSSAILSGEKVIELCQNLSPSILVRAIDDVFGSPDEARKDVIDVWTHIAALEEEEKNHEIRFLRMFIQEETQGEGKIDWPSFLRMLVEKYESTSVEEDNDGVVEV